VEECGRVGEVFKRCGAPLVGPSIRGRAALGGTIGRGLDGRDAVWVRPIRGMHVWTNQVRGDFWGLEISRLHSPAQGEFRREWHSVSRGRFRPQRTPNFARSTCGSINNKLNWFIHDEDFWNLATREVEMAGVIYTE
jgi:hypothetical protein